MTHPQHGSKHAYTLAEVAADEKNGWQRTPEPIAPLPDVEPARKKLTLAKGAI
jgi:hypothetical protein